MQRCVITCIISHVPVTLLRRVFVWGYTAFDTLSTLYTLGNIKCKINVQFFGQVKRSQLLLK